MELISIPVDVFQTRRQELANTDIPAMISRAIEQLKQKYPMLTQVVSHSSGSRFHNENNHHNNSHGRSNHHGHHSQASGSGSNRPHRGFGGGGGGHHPRRAERPRIGTRELSREDMSRKDFVANMNKLSRQNYDSILRLIRTTYNSNFLSNYMDIIWELMMRQTDYQDLHIQVIEHLLMLTPPEKKHLVQVYWNEKCQLFFDEEKWIPVGEIATLLNSPTSSEEYDEFCDYIKWKKRIASSFQAWIRLMISKLIEPNFKKCFEHLCTAIDNAFDKKEYKYLDCLLEWLLQVSRVIPSNDAEFLQVYNELEISSKLESWQTRIQEAHISSSFRFKILDIQELYQKTTLS